MIKLKKTMKRTGKIFLCFLLVVALVNILAPLFCRKPDEKYAENLRQTEFTSETAGAERIRCIDDNEEALLWRLRMIGTAKESIVLSTFDLRADENGTKLLAALNHAAAKGVKIQLLIDGIYQQLFLAGSSDFQALAAHENVEVGVYNPVTPANLFKLNYRMHDKYVIIDEKMYLLGGRNSNDIFLGDHTEDINVDRDILVYDTSEGQGESLQQLENYFHEIWNESCVHVKKGKESSKYADQYQHMEEIYASLLEKYNDIETYNSWAKDTTEANKITLIDNGTQADRKTPQVLQTIQYLSENADHVISGARASIFSTFILVAVISIFGTIVGVGCGYYGGIMDSVMMRISDVCLAFPGLVFAMAIAAILGGGIQNAIIALAVISWPKYSRIARSQTLALKNEPYIHAAILSGDSSLQIMLRHVFPNMLGPVLVTAMLDIGTMMMELAGLSFLGLGAQIPMAEWGSMMSSGRSMIQTYPWVVLSPGIAIFVSVVIFNLLGDTVRDYLDPKNREAF